ncbi:hypothetical protein SteCoe_16887 [Stentor coeruleus]|uniref:Vacuolar protein sorting-associated protein 54 C-terminal domain-containing protein n=1 Tax=Stentor coeruleus TaxID=5963 RepID=A0A1R2C058_9CILI|nr:hypothetical protein SteCoe_16887 [Stentor coeruleus]
MEALSSGRSSTSSANISHDNIVIVSNLLRNSSQYKTSQSLTSVVNTPDSSLFDYVYDYIYNSLNFGVEPSAILQDINPEDFNPYLYKISQYLKDKTPQVRKNFTSEFTLEKCLAEIPSIFFKEDFQIEDFLDESAIKQQEMISIYLDLTDMSIFNKISIKWEDIMTTAYGLETLSLDIDTILKGIQTISQNTKLMQSELIQKYLKIIKLNRRLGNMQKVEKKLKLISTIKDVQPKMNELINQGHYTSVTQLLAKTQETFKSELKGIKCLKDYSLSLEKTKNNLSSQLDQEFSISAYQFVVLNTFSHSEKLVKLLKTNGSLDMAYKIFPKETSYERMNELIRNKINTQTLQPSLQDMKKTISKEIQEQVKKLMGLLGVHKTDENSKWVNISHPHFIIVFQSLLAIFNSIFQKFVTLGTLILREFCNESTSYGELKKQLSNTVSKVIVVELSEIETSLLEIFFKKVGKIVNARETILITSGTQELKEIYELSEKASTISRNLLPQQNNPITQSVVSIEKKFLSAFHERKLSELENILNNEPWIKSEVPEEMIKYIMDRRGEASKIAGIKLENPDITATGSLLMFYKILYEYVKIGEELQIPVECASRLLEILKFYNRKTYELIIEAKAVPQKLPRVTSKHLALSVQGLTFILQEFYYIENRLQTKVKEFAMVLQGEMTNTKQDYTSHLKAINDKLCQIIILRVDEHCKSAITEAKWDTMISPSQIDKDYYVKQITTDLASMHSILLMVLNNNQLLEVFSTILQSLSDNLIELYSKIKIDGYIPAQRIKNDIQQLLITLREKFSQVLLEPLEDLDDRLQKFILDRCECFLKV